MSQDDSTQGSRSGDDAELAEFGYRPELKRTLGNFHTFAAGISYISILTGTFQLFYFGFANGGPAYWWSWPMVFGGQFMVALCFAELAARYPVAGSVYNWAKKVGNPHIGWLAGWMMLLASVVSIAAVALAYQLTLPQISSSFQFIGDGTGPYDVATNAVALAAVLILFTTLVNAFGVKLMATINTAGVFLELIATVVLIVLFAVHIVRGPQVVTHTAGAGHGQPFGYLSAFLVASLASAYVMYGFDTAASLGEESLDPTRGAPRAIIRAIVASFVLGGLILLLALMSVSSLTGKKLSTDGLQYVVLDVLGPTAGKAMLWCVLIAVTVCALAVHTAAIRLAFAMSRDNNLPAVVGPRPGQPALQDTGRPGRRHRRPGARDPGRQHPSAADLHRGHQHRHHHDLPRLSAGHRPDAGGPPARQVAARGRREVLPRPLGTARQHHRRAVGRRHDHQPDLAARSRLQRRRPLPLVPALGSRPVHRCDRGRRLRLLLVRPAAPHRCPRRARGPAHPAR